MNDINDSEKFLLAYPFAGFDVNSVSDTTNFVVIMAKILGDVFHDFAGSLVELESLHSHNSCPVHVRGNYDAHDAF